MSIEVDRFDFTVPLTLQNHQTAQQLSDRHADPDKVKQVYLNTLTLQAVSFYLSCLGADTDLESSESWDPTLQALSDIADLQVKGKGRLECRSVFPGDRTCSIPPEVWSDRMGYVIVQLDRDLTEATLLGFVPEVHCEELPLSDLQPLDRLLDCLNSYEPAREPIVLGDWLFGLFDAGWDAIAAVLEQPDPDLAFQFRTAHPVPADAEKEPTGGVKRGKRLHLGEPQGEVALFVSVAPSSTSDMEIAVELYPLQGRRYLPPALRLQVLDGSSKVILQAEAGSSEGLEFQFKGEPGEPFSVRVALGDLSFTEVFQI